MLASIAILGSKQSASLVYATWNPSDADPDVTLSNGNLTATCATSVMAPVRSTIGVSAGKHYLELKLNTVASQQMGVWQNGDAITLNPYQTPSGYIMWADDGFKGNNNVGSAYGGARANNDIIGIKLDMDAGTISIVINGADQGIMYSGLSGTFYVVVAGDVTGGQSVTTANFGATAFAQSVPSGYRAGLYT